MGEGRLSGDRRDRRRLTVPQAATVLGVTVDAVRGRIRRGKLPSEHDENGTVYVWVEAGRPEPSQTVEGPSRDQSELVEELRDRVRALEEANHENRRLLAAALERIPAIEPPETRDARETVSEGEPGAGPPADTTGEPRRSWWRRFFGGE